MLCLRTSDLPVGSDDQINKWRRFDRVSASEFLGRAVMTMEEVRRLPSSRQIIPLTSGRSGTGSMTSGSITVEVRLSLLFILNCRTFLIRGFLGFPAKIWQKIEAVLLYHAS